MFGLICILVIAAVSAYVVYRLGWKEAVAAVSILAAGLYTGGQQMWDALSVFFAAVF